MNSIKSKHIMRGLFLCATLAASTPSHAQWEYNRIETLTDRADSFKDQGLFESAYGLYPEIMLQLRVHEGLYSVKQVSMLMEEAGWHVGRGDLKEADDLLDRAEFYAGKNADPLENYRKLVVQRLYLPDEQQCFVLEGDRFFNRSNDCEALRFFRADSFIAATEIMIKIVEISDDRLSDLTKLAGLAEFTAICVYEAFGVTSLNNRSDSQFGYVYKSDNDRIIHENYRFQKWQRVHRQTLSQLESEFEFGV